MSSNTCICINFCSDCLEAHIQLNVNIKRFDIMAIDFCLCKSRYQSHHFKLLCFVNLLLYKFAQANAPSCTLLPMYLIQNPYFQSPCSLLCRNLKVCLFKKFNDIIIITKLIYGLQF